MGIEGSEHEETAPDAPALVVSKLAISLAGKTKKIKILSGSLVHQVYGQDEVTEKFVCNYGLNPKFRDIIEKRPLTIVGVDLDGEVRAVEISDHPFYVGTLYQPQLSSAPDSLHPLIVAYLRAVVAFRKSGNRRL